MMKTVAISVVLAALMVAGCGNQPQQATPNNARPVAQTATPNIASTAPSTPQKGTPVLVSSALAPVTAPAPASKPAPTANPTQAATTDEDGRLDLPEEDETIALQGPARKTLEAALATASGNGPVALPNDATAAVIDSTSGTFQNSCDAIAKNWVAKEYGSGKWTAQILFSTRGSEGTKAVLAIRCATTVASNEDPYDERPAIVSITPETATLKLIPLSAREGEDTLYHLGFSQAFRASGAQLVELDAYHTSDNPCCGGADEQSGTRKVILDLVTDKIALSDDQQTEWDSHDDSDDSADTQTVCEAKFAYSRDAAGNVESIATEMHCTENDKPQPVTKQTFTWNADAHQFVLVK